MLKKEEKEESLLKELCGDDAKLYDVLGSLLYIDPIVAISRTDLEVLIEEAEKSVKDLSYEMARLEYRPVVDKAIFEATQNPEERSRYKKVIKDLVSKIVGATEKAKEKLEKNGLTDKATSLERRIEKYKFVRERVEDVINVASHFYNERLTMLAETGRRGARREAMREIEREEKREEQKARERRKERREAIRKMGREERREAETEEKKIEEIEGERREERRKERREAETEEKKIEEIEGERRETRREERREARRKVT